LPSQGILREAEQADADLIIMGTHQHTSIGEALLGSTALKVLHYSSKPVLLIRIPKDYRED
ncbi:MAG: universal stress protein, partial [Desulfuromonadales bacterium]|nr:universal stress protein [Desulfuromonadales bacterium]NIS40623.1 universal stress protein [Desulfuromonadales bacterium]